MRFANKVVVVTGAARGIGRAVAEAFAAEGARVLGADVQPGEPFPGIEYVPCDVAGAGADGPGGPRPARAGQQRRALLVRPPGGVLGGPV